MIDSAVIDLAGPGLAGDAQRLAGGDVEGDMVDDDAAALGRRDLGDEVANGEDGGRHAGMLAISTHADPLPLGGEGRFSWRACELRETG